MIVCALVQARVFVRSNWVVCLCARAWECASIYEYMCGVFMVLACVAYSKSYRLLRQATD